MKQVERSGERWKMRVSGAFLSGVCELDRAANRVTVRRHMLDVPYFFTTFSLSEIGDITVLRHKRRRRYLAAIELRSGKKIPIGQFSKDEALEIARALRDFLTSNRSLPAELPNDQLR